MLSVYSNWGRKGTNTLENISIHDTVQAGDKEQTSVREAKHGGTAEKKNVQAICLLETAVLLHRKSDCSFDNCIFILIC